MTFKDLRIAFMGTPEFAVPSLQMLQDMGADIRMVITQPDRPHGRGHRLLAPPVKQYAETAGLPVWQPARLRDPENVEKLRSLDVNLLITAAYGQILSEEILEVPAYGCINVHASLLPAYRGAAPVEWSIINGEKETGITTMRTVRALDAGPVLEQDVFPIPPEMTGGQLREALSHLGAETLKRTLQKLVDGTLEETPQDEESASYVSMMPKGFGEIDWDQPAENVRNFIRALAPEPGAFIRLPEEGRVRIYSAASFDGDPVEPGTIVHADGRSGLVISAKDGLIAVGDIKRPNARRMSSADSLRGRPIKDRAVAPREEA